MPTLTAWCYQTPLGARVGEVRLHMLEDARLLEVHSALVVTWVHGAHRPRATPVRQRVGAEAQDAVVLGALARAVLAIATSDDPGTAATATAERISSTGIDRDFLLDSSRHLAPGRSMLVVLSGEADLDVVRPLVQRELAAGVVELLRVELPPAAIDEMAAVLEPPGG